MTSRRGQKDPKKVAAGRAGAAARKQKEQQLLDELRKSKNELVAPSPTPEKKAADDSEPAVFEGNSPGIWIVSGLLAAGGLWAISKLLSRTAPSPERPAAAKQLVPRPVEQLKEQDPFVME